MSDDPGTTEYWLERKVHPSIPAAARTDEPPAWVIGDAPARVKTVSGSVYTVESDGTLSGGSKNVVDARLNGATPMGMSVIRTNCIVVGLQMEYAVDMERYHSSSVESVVSL